MFVIYCYKLLLSLIISIGINIFRFYRTMKEEKTDCKLLYEAIRTIEMTYCIL